MKILINDRRKMNLSENIKFWAYIITSWNHTPKLAAILWNHHVGFEGFKDSPASKNYGILKGYITSGFSGHSNPSRQKFK